MADEQTWTKEKLKSRIDGNELDLSLCSISKVPIRGLLSFPKVTVLDLSCNRINVLPEQFIQLVNLTQLDLSKNSLSELPEDFGKLKRLRKLDLFSNNLKALPLSFHELENLQWLDLKANPIQDALPQVVGDCLQPAECKACAEKMVGYIKSLYQQKLMEVARAKQQQLAESAKQQKEDEAVRLRRREEKQRRKEEYQRALPLKEDDDTYLGQEKETCIMGNALPLAGRRTTMTSCRRAVCLAVLVLLGALVVTCLTASRFFENEWNSFVDSARVLAARLVETLSQGL